MAKLNVYAKPWRPNYDTATRQINGEWGDVKVVTFVGVSYIVHGIEGEDTAYIDIHCIDGAIWRAYEDTEDNRDEITAFVDG